VNLLSLKSIPWWFNVTFSVRLLVAQRATTSRSSNFISIIFYFSALFVIFLAPHADGEVYFLLFVDSREEPVGIDF